MPEHDQPDAPEYRWEGHYLVDKHRICPHGIHVEYRCKECDADFLARRGDEAYRERLASMPPNLRIPKTERWGVEDKKVDEAETK